ncbi:redoxin domain-containing protein [Sulfurimonas sp. HSL-3221]|uniref:TlpA disulfide reductase family protein n=1 Tax=Sulfurimonadaceae TaxID=2771471 RepID=UPI001E2BF974|nr:TlpA disulfide reductase family protein [Sulfurimonas sp. HSL-3221]UFS63383.1 redoxin domain-containing protein [Sulfurimonas sp. HSL-3221]
MKRIMMMMAALLLTMGSAGAAEMFTLKAAGEKTIAATELPNGMRFRGFDGKPVLVNFFGKQCRYCKKEIPHLEALKKRYGGRIGIIGIHMQGRMMPQERAQIAGKAGFNYPVFEYEDNMAIVQHIGSRARFNGSIPFNIVFNGKGEVSEIIPGYLSDKDLEMIFSELLKK